MERNSMGSRNADKKPQELFKLQIGKIEEKWTVRDLITSLNKGRKGTGAVVRVKMYPSNEIVDVRLQNQHYRLRFLNRKELHLELVTAAEQYRITSTTEIDLSYFQIMRQIGEGTFASVYLAEEKYDRRLVAIKAINRLNCRQLGEWSYLINELEVLKRLRTHQFVLRLYFAFEDECNVYLVTDYHPAGDLFTFMARKRLTVDQCKGCFVQIVHALKAVHNLGYVYRDLKPENILVSEEGTLKLADFGFARKLQNGKVKGVCGSYEYMAPEMLALQDYDQSYDVYSLGILLFQILVGRTPFRGATRNNITQLVNQGIEFPQTLSPSEQSLIRSLTKLNPAERLGSTNILDILNHEWFETIPPADPLFNAEWTPSKPPSNQEWRSFPQTASEFAQASYNYLQPQFDVPSKKFGPKLNASQINPGSR